MARLILIFFLGVSFLAIQHKNFPCNRALKTFRGVERPAIAFLWSTFGRNTRCLARWFDEVKDRPHYIQVYLLNQVCVRKGNCRRGEINRGWSTSDWNKGLVAGHRATRKKIIKRVLEIRRFIAAHKNDNTTPVLCLALEDDFTDRAAYALNRLIRHNWPWQVCRNPNSALPRSFAGADIYEGHGSNTWIPAGGNACLDGEDIEFPHRRATIPNTIAAQHVPAYLSQGGKKRTAVLLWAAMHQGLRGGSGSAPAPRLRTPSVPAKDVQCMRRWLKDAQK